MPTNSLNVTVTYLAAEKPFHDAEAATSETLGGLKKRILDTFDLKEGAQGGNQITYLIYRGKERLDDLTATLGALAGQAHALALKLVQHIEQG